MYRLVLSALVICLTLTACCGQVTPRGPTLKPTPMAEPTPITRDEYDELLARWGTIIGVRLIPQMDIILETDVVGMCAIRLYDASALVQEIENTTPPTDAASVHRCLLFMLEEYQAWRSDINRFCSTNTVDYLKSALSHAAAIAVYSNLYSQELRELRGRK